MAIGIIISSVIHPILYVIENIALTKGAGTLLCHNNIKNTKQLYCAGAVIGTGYNRLNGNESCGGLTACVS